jgi:ribosome maturation factor RimP
MEQTGELERLIEPAVTGLGYELVRVQVKGGRQTTLQIMAERQDRRAMLVDDCARLSREISALLDQADPIAGAYTLEVSSPGIDRPLMKPADYQRFAGHEARLEVDPPVEARKRLHGTLVAVEGDDLRLATDAGEIRVPLASIQRAKLVLTDRLIALAMKEAGDRDHSQAAEDAASLAV